MDAAVWKIVSSTNFFFDGGCCKQGQGCFEKMAENDVLTTVSVVLALWQ